MPTITSVVVKADLGVSVDLYALANILRNVKYDPTKFPGLVWHHSSISGSCCLFKSGRIVCHGNRCLKAGKSNIRKYARIIEKIGYPVRIENILIQTIAAKHRIKGGVPLEQIEKWMGGTYKGGAKHPTVTFRRQGIHFTIHRSGKALCSGLSSLEAISKLVKPTLLEIQLACLNG